MLAPCNIWFLNTINYIEVQKYLYIIYELNSEFIHWNKVNKLWTNRVDVDDDNKIKQNGMLQDPPPACLAAFYSPQIQQLGALN